MSLESSGGIVINAEGKIALVCQHGNSWSFPKGHLHEGESLLSAAKREIAEETGLTDLTLVQELGSYERYSIGKDGIGEAQEFGFRKRTFFLFTTTQHNFATQDTGEVTNTKWATLEEALAMLTHPKDKEFLASVRAIVEKEIK